MRVPDLVLNRLISWANYVMTSPRSKLIGINYLERWHVIPRNGIFNIYLHRYHGSDDDRALHDHPWPSLSVMLSGRLIEHDLKGSQKIEAGNIRIRSANYAHRLELVEIGAMTLFITGPRIREWGFLCPNGWRHWKDFTNPDDSGQIGRGCE